MEAIFFDLDGTLLSMDQDEFIDAYFSLLSVKVGSLGLNTKETIKAVWTGTAAMIQNDGTMSNRERFWKTLISILGTDASQMEPVFDRFYAEEFNQVQRVVRKTPYPAQIIQCLKSKGYRLLLATNPVFPSAATLARIRWAGLDSRDFEVITTYETIGYCKPNPKYYQTLLEQRNFDPAQVLMVGNDVSEDVEPALSLGMHTYLITDNRIDKTGGKIVPEHESSLKDFLAYAKSLPEAAQSA